jgi:hypothetical protein
MMVTVMDSMVKNTILGDMKPTRMAITTKKVISRVSKTVSKVDLSVIAMSILASHKDSGPLLAIALNQAPQGAFLMVDNKSIWVYNTYIDS